MKKVSLLFPGQGSQYVGMGLDLFEKFDVAKEIYLKAESILGYDIKEISFNGPSEKLKNTEICQPAIFLHSINEASSVTSLGLTLNCSTIISFTLSSGEISDIFLPPFVLKSNYFIV